MKEKYYFLITVFNSFLITLFSSPVAYAQEPQAWTEGRCFKIVEGVQVATIQGLECLFANIVRVLTPFAGIAVFIMIVVGAFQLITAGGEAKQVQKARKTLTSVFFGLMVFIGIWFILRLIQTITGVEVTKFEIPK